MQVNISNLIFSCNILATTNLREKPSCCQDILFDNKSITTFIKTQAENKEVEQVDFFILTPWKNSSIVILIKGLSTDSEKLPTYITCTPSFSIVLCFWYSSYPKHYDCLRLIQILLLSFIRCSMKEGTEK